MKLFLSPNSLVVYMFGSLSNEQDFFWRGGAGGLELLWFQMID